MSPARARGGGRAARFGVSPTTDCSCAEPSPIKSPTTISPVAIPTRAWSLADLISGRPTASIKPSPVCETRGDLDAFHAADIRVHAAGVNFADSLMVGGTYQVKPQFPFTPGLEAAGEIVETPAAPKPPKPTRYAPSTPRHPKAWLGA